MSLRRLKVEAMKFAVLGALLAFLSVGCAHKPEVQNSAAAFEWLTKSFEGGTERRVVDAWGYPTRELKSPDGNKVLEFNATRKMRTAIVVHTSSSTKWGSSAEVSGGEELEFQCSTWFEIAQEKVKKVTSRGNDCTLPVRHLFGAEVIEGSWRVFSVDQQSFAAKLGLKDGDVFRGLVFDGRSGETEYLFPQLPKSIKWADSDCRTCGKTDFLLLVKNDKLVRVPFRDK
jgi:hypothetical protein